MYRRRRLPSRARPRDIRVSYFLISEIQQANLMPAALAIRRTRMLPDLRHVAELRAFDTTALGPHIEPAHIET